MVMCGFILSSGSMPNTAMDEARYVCFGSLFVTLDLGKIIHPVPD